MKINTNYTAMNKILNLLSTICIIVLFASSCEKEPIIELSQSSFGFSDQGGSQTISFSTNKNWSATVSGGTWCTISTESGSSEVKSITVTVIANDTYDDRSATITIKSEELSKVITISQSKSKAILITKNRYEVGTTGGSISVELRTNIDYDVIIPAENQSWITNTTTKGLITTNLTFSIAANATYDNRQGKIILKEKTSVLTDTIYVYQYQKDAIILSSKTENVSSYSLMFEVELRTNIDFEIIIPEYAKSWISYTATKSLRTETLLLSIAENKSNEIRSAEIYIKNKANSFQDTLTINQQEQFVCWINKMGTLSTILNQTQKDTISKMIVRGEINKTDFEVMKNQMPELRYLDLKDVKCEGDMIPFEALGGRNPNKNINTLILPLSIKTIYSRAFEECTGLTSSLNFPEGLKVIGISAYKNCTGLSGSLMFPAGLETIEIGAFENCTGFTGSLNLPDGLKKLGKAAFYKCHGFTGSLNLPDGLTTIGESTFEGCYGFTGTLNLPDGLKTIDIWAFLGCYGFTGSLNFPDGLTKIGSSAFWQCYGFNGSLNLPHDLTTIGEGAFAYCSGLTGTLSLPAGLTTIGDYAFAICSSLTGLEIGNSLTTINKFAFYQCSKLTGSVTFPTSLISIGEGGFKLCNSVKAFRFPHTTPPQYYTDILPSGAVVEVPYSAVATYKATEGWKNYNIVGY